MSEWSGPRSAALRPGPLAEYQGFEPTFVPAAGPSKTGFH
jgi:hypothetical protein